MTTNTVDDSLAADDALIDNLGGVNQIGAVFQSHQSDWQGANPDLYIQ